MKTVAKISFPAGGLILPAKSPYEREMLFEHIAQYARQYGQIRVTVDRRDWMVALANADSQICTGCGERPTRLQYTSRGATFCLPCARHELR